MKIVRGIALGMAALALVVVSAAPGLADSNAASTPKTVGDFLAAYARALNIELPASASSDAVVATLRASSVKLDANIDPAKALTQADVVKIGSANGVHVTTQNPAKGFSAAEIDQFFISYGPVLAQTSSAASTSVAGLSAGSERFGSKEHHRPNKGKGKMKGKGHQSPDEPDDHDDHI